MKSLKSKITQLKIIIVFIILIYLSFFVLLFIFGDQVKFSPSVFINEYAKFLSTLTLALLSFWAINYIWELKKDIIKEEYNLVNNVEKLPHLVANYKEIRTKISILLDSNNYNDEELKTCFSSMLSNLESIHKVVKDVLIKYPEYKKKKYILFDSDNVLMQNSIEKIIDESKRIENIKLFMKNSFQKIMDKNEPKLLNFIGKLIKQ